MGWELDSLRTELVEAVRAEVARAESQRVTANGTEAEEEQHGLEAPQQPPMAG